MKDFPRFSNIFYKRIQSVKFSVRKGFSLRFLFTYIFLFEVIVDSLILIPYSYSVMLPLILIVAYTWWRLYLFTLLLSDTILLRLYLITTLLHLYLIRFRFTYCRLYFMIRLYLCDTSTSLANAFTSLIRRYYFTRITSTWNALSHS